MNEDVEYGRYFDALVAGEREVCHEIFVKWLNSGIDLRTLYEQRI